MMGYQYLSNLQAIVDLVLEGAHLHLANEVGVDKGFLNDEGQELREVGQDDGGLVVGRGV